MNKSELHVDLEEAVIGKDYKETIRVNAYKFEIRVSPLERHSKEDLPREITVDLYYGRIRVRVYDGLKQEPTTIILGE